MGFLDRLRGKPSGPPPEQASTPIAPPAADLRVPPPDSVDHPPRAEQLEWLEESARELVAPAFDTRDDARERLLEQYVLDDDLDVTADDVEAALARVWDERRALEQTWSDEGDYARVEAAFAHLESAGIVARMNFTCCQTCGHAEIGDERVEQSRGYVFFHQQDAERLAPGGSDLYLAFGGFGYAASLDPDLVARARAGDEEAKRAAIVASEELVGADVATALRGQGLEVDWDGTCAQRIHVTGLDWRKRLPV